jgi:hypothetical protein
MNKTINIHRSPEDFHGKMRNITSTNLFRRQLSKYGEFVGFDNILVLQNEKLTANSTRVALENFTSSEISNEAWNLMQFTAVNKNDGSKVNVGMYSVHVLDNPYRNEGLYAISNFRPMLSETRKLLNEAFYEECKWLCEKFRVCYEECNH